VIVTNKVDVIFGLQYGDEGKGKIAAAIAQLKAHNLTARYNGGPNAGHTIVREDGKRFELHQLPSSVVYGGDAYIGPGTVLDIDKLDQEIETVLSKDPTLNFNLYIDPRVPVIDTSHIIEDTDYQHRFQGSTNSGIAPAYASFYNRRARTVVDEIEDNPPKPTRSYTVKKIDCVNSLLLEGAQGFYLDINQGVYPYTTSSHCLPAAAAATFGFDPRTFRNIIGVAKCYETRSGTDPYFYEHECRDQMPLFDQIRRAGREVGVTTGRDRKVNYLDLDKLVNAIISSGTNIVVINKWDILEELQVFKLWYNKNLINFKTLELMQTFVEETINFKCLNAFENDSQTPIVIHSSSPQNDIDWSKFF